MYATLGNFSGGPNRISEFAVQEEMAFEDRPDFAVDDESPLSPEPAVIM